jgi:beta-lactamase class D
VARRRPLSLSRLPDRRGMDRPVDLVGPYDSLLVRRVAIVVVGSVALGGPGCAPHTETGSACPPQIEASRLPSSCFLLYELGVGEVMRAPAALCSARVTPASTFKIPHALAALDAGVLSGPDARMLYDGAPARFETWRRDHTLASAMRYSVVWYFQRVARLLGDERERQYLARLEYGNQDSSSGLESFWLGGSLLISPDEQERFLVRLYSDTLPVAEAAMQGVRSVLVQPRGVVVNAEGGHPFSGPWPEDAVLSAKTGSSDDAGRSVRWLVGHLERRPRSWVFVSCVVGERLEPLAAIELAEASLRRALVAVRW